MERIPPAIAQFEVDGGYLPENDDAAEMAWPASTATAVAEAAQDPEQRQDLIDASIFTAMLHP